MRWLTVALLTLLPLTNSPARAQRVATRPLLRRGPLANAFGICHLKNARMTDNAKMDLTKTKVVRLASQQVGKDLFRQIHDVKFTEKSGKVIEVLTMNDASYEECSESGVDVFVVAQHLGGR
jgi:hypothetical protein